MNVFAWLAGRTRASIEGVNRLPKLFIDPGVSAARWHGQAKLATLIYTRTQLIAEVPAMNQSKPDGSSQDSLDKLLDTLTPEQKETLRRKLNERAWTERFERLCSGAYTPSDREDDTKIGQKVAVALEHLIERLSSGDIDEDIKKACQTAWESLTADVQTQTKSKQAETVHCEEDLQNNAEAAFEQAQNDVIQLRQSVAQAVATEKMLEQQIQKNRDQAETWRNRADMAAQQNNEELSKQALQRRDMYEKTTLELENQHKKQKDALVDLRERHNKLEAQIQKVSTKKQILVAREKVAEATAKANAILVRSDASGALAVLERMEKKVAEKEAIASALIEAADSTQAPFETEINATLAKAVASIDRLTAVIERMEQKVIDDEAKAGLGHK